MAAGGSTELPVSGIIDFVVFAVISIISAFPVKTTLPFAILKLKVVTVVGIVKVEIAVGVLKGEDIAAIIRLNICAE